MLQTLAGCFALLRPGTGTLFSLITVLSFLTCVLQPAQSQTYKVIYNFTGLGSDGATPYGGPILDLAGNIYGATNLGGTFGAGTVYELSPNGSSWTYTSLYSFRGGGDGSGPGFGSLALRHDCSLFGTTEGGGVFGTAFKVRPVGNPCHVGTSWRETVPHHFGTGTDGAQPMNGVVFDKAGNFYGTTSLGGDFGNGAVFQAVRAGQNWVETTIYSFTGGSDGTNPVATVTLGSDGSLYGTTSFGGANGIGCVYKLSPSGSGWTQTVLYDFQGLSDGEFPVGGVIFDKDGNLYGTTFGGGDNGGGTVYKLSPSGGSWTLTTLFSFNGSFSGPYNKLTFDTHGTLYGFTNGGGANGLGSVFTLTPAGDNWTFSDLYDFSGGSEGGSPYGSLAVDALGNIFGTAVVGGSNNQGVVFEITP